MSPEKASNAHSAATGSGGTLDGSAAQIGAFLLELVEITGQQEIAGAPPVLELCFGDVVTVTTLIDADGAAWLSITAMLGSMTGPEPLLLVSRQARKEPAPEQEWNYMWHADEGHCVVWRRIPVNTLRNERAVMDAIIGTADEAGSRLLAGRSK